MRLEETQIWEFNLEHAGSLALPLVAAGAGAAMTFYADGRGLDTLTLGAGIVTVVVGAYLAVDWMGRLSRLLDEHRLREVEMLPDIVRLDHEHRLVEARTRLVEAIAALTGDHLAYARQVLATSDLVLDTDHERAAWRVHGQEFPLRAATAWMEEYRKLSSGSLPADVSWRPEMGITREQWRQAASCMAAVLSGMGVAQRSGGPIPPHWTIDDPQEREAALARSMVLLADELNRQLRGEP